MISPTAPGFSTSLLEKNRLRLYAGRLPYQTTDQDLADLFGQYGQVLSANVITDRDTGRSKGFGFVEMSNDQEAQTAINELNNSTLEGRTIVVNEAQERRDSRGGGDNRGRRPDGGGGYRERRY